MIHLHPCPVSNHRCPHCGTALQSIDWYMPGMRMLAELSCPDCDRRYYGDLPAGGGLYYPMLLDQETGQVFDAHGVPWFADWLEQSYVNRIDTPVELTVEQFAPLHKPVLLNCLDTLYGHCLLKLLNAQVILDRHAGHDLIVLVPAFLRWMVPDGVAAVWSVDWPLDKGTQWNDRLAGDLKRRIADLGQCQLSVALSHPHPRDFDIERFTGVPPFPIDQLSGRLDRPTVTFIWRDDRRWEPDGRGSQPNGSPPSQTQAVTCLAESIRTDWPAVRFSIVGMGHAGGLPDWIADLRQRDPDEQVERRWCRQYADSHLVIGVHGSNMLLPSAHAGVVLDLMPSDRWGNALQDILTPARDPREAVLRCRLLPASIGPEELALIAGQTLRHFPDQAHQLWGDGCRHLNPKTGHRPDARTLQRL
ncbi:MAG: hypothetical protein ACE5GE_11500 [Phycisphaerae bacterium]